MLPARGDVRPSALAGQWYPGRQAPLRDAVKGYLDAADVAPTSEALRSVEAVVTPHAGYVYSGPTAGVAWAAVRGKKVERVVMVGPAHRVPFRGVALGDYAAWLVPTGRVAVDRQALAELEAAGLGVWVPEAHVEEHCLEIQLPFLLEALGEVPIVPLLMGRVSHEGALAAIQAVVRDGDLLVLSSDLSHYDPYEVARRHDLDTLAHIVGLDVAALDGSDACGHRGVGAGCALAAARGWRAVLLDYKSSGDTAGDKQAVVGYGAVAMGPPA
ncbi:MAG: AmmeMemoRadiSam system protein B [Myxococcota bacterium]